MAELIEKGALMERLNVFNDKVHGNEHFIYGIETAKELLEDMPTTTESEIRAKAIEEAVIRLYNLCYLQTWVKEKDLKQLAEQLKESE